jgi:D-sedoheptulose 7-phosphate isomerase
MNMIKEYLRHFEQKLSNTLISNENGETLDHTIAYNSLVSKLAELHQSTHIIYLIGNGGSSAIVSHSAVDFINTCQIKAYPLTEHSQLTCMANDYGYENVFRNQIDMMMGPEDVLIAVSSSGSSPNIVRAAEIAREKKAFLITLTGFSPDNRLRKMGNFNFWLDTMDYGQVEIGHALLLHILTDKLGKKIRTF